MLLIDPLWDEMLTCLPQATSYEKYNFLERAHNATSYKLRASKDAVVTTHLEH